MSKNLLKFCAMFSLVASIGMTTACGNNDTGEENNGNNENNTNNMNNGCATGEVEVTVDGNKVCKKDCSTDASVCGAEETCQDSGSNKVCLPKPADECEEGKVKVGDACLVDCSADANVCQATEECKDEGGQKVCKAKEVSMDKTAPKCSDATPPKRCGEDAASFTEWQPASVISEFALANPSDITCCFDYNGDGTPDNGLGDALSLQGDVFGSVNDGISGGIADGSFALVLEHDGVDLAAGGDFSVYFLLGSPTHDPPAPKDDGSGTYEIDPVSFESGTYPQAAALGNLTDGKVTAGPGTIFLNIALFDVSLSLKVTAVQIAADVGSKTSADAGVFLENGQLGGIIAVTDVFDALNNFASTNCGCVDIKGAPLSGPLVVYDEQDLAASSCTGDKMERSTERCDSENQIEGICKTLVDEACTFVPLIADIAPDIDKNAIGQDCLDDTLGLNCNAISIGATFEAFGGKIVGVEAAAPGE